MAAAIFLVTRTVQGVNQDINQVREVIMNNDDGDADVLIIQNLIDSMNAVEPAGDPSGARNQYPDGYFDTVVQIGATPALNLGTEFDFLAYASHVSELEA